MYSVTMYSGVCVKFGLIRGDTGKGKSARDDYVYREWYGQVALADVSPSE